jgi:hypothetical protein
MPSSVSTSLNKAVVKPFSKQQTLVALLDWFAGLPLDERRGLASHYFASLAQERPHVPPTPAATSGPEKRRTPTALSV